MPITPGDIVQFQTEQAYALFSSCIFRHGGTQFTGLTDNTKWNRPYVVVRVWPEKAWKKCPQLVQLIPISTPSTLYSVDGVPSYGIKANELSTRPNMPKGNCAIVVGLCGVAPLETVEPIRGRIDPKTPEMIATVTLRNRSKFKKLLEVIPRIWPETRTDLLIRFQKPKLEAAKKLVKSSKKPESSAK